MTRSTFKRKNFSLYLAITFILLSIFIGNFILYNQNSNFIPYKEGEDVKEVNMPHLAAQETFTAVWVENPTLNTPIEPTWYSKLKGEISDIKTTTSLGQANYIVIGDSGTVNIDESLSNTDWAVYSNPDLPILPDTYEINSSGCYVSHLWDENLNQTRNRPSIHWKRDITTPVNFSDYIITSASLDVVFNATVTVSPHNGGGIDREGDSGLDAYSTGDYTEFYVLLSDVEENFAPVQVAFNNTGDLGRDSPSLSNYPDSFMNVVPEDVLISVLTSILENDGYNFTITLGLDIYCEDNEWGVDRDNWNSLIIRSFNLTFSYEKKIEQFTTASWNQDGDKISDISNDTIIIDEAKLNFKYMIDENWTDSSPNSEIQAYINNNKLSETVKLSNADSNFQIAKPGGFDVTSLIPYDIGINLSIQVYLADEFGLGNNITISIDDIYLNITYTVLFPDTQTNLHIFFNGNNKTSNPVYEHPVNQDINITVKYPDNFGLHIPGALVQLSGNLTGTLYEDSLHEQYTIIIGVSELEIGEFYFDVVAHRINYEARKISPILIVSKVTTDNLQLLLNGQNKTSDPFMDIALNKLLNVTIEYKDPFGTHVPDALVELTGDGIFETLVENPSLEHYSLVLNTTIKFSLGINELTITAQESEYQEKSINPHITVRKINAEIIAIQNTIQTYPGGDALIRIYINNTDFNINVTGATVTYTRPWDNVTQLLLDLDEDGIYEATIPNIPNGIHSIVINAFGSDIYHFESQEIVITAARNAPNTLLFQILTAIGITAAIVIGAYLYAYQRVLKYPKTVRKVRKYRKKLKSKSPPTIAIIERKKAINSAYSKELAASSSFLKGKPSVEPAKPKNLSKGEEI
jgi:hypothetical protein